MNSDGVGLGLTIVKQVVDAYRGEIEVLSEGQGTGTTFVLSMKMSAAAVESVSDSGSDSEPSFRLYQF